MNETMLKLVQGKEQLYPHELGKQFPRILHKIIELWDTPQLEAYFTDLMVNTRDTERQGFPKEVVSEIYYLSQVYDRTRTRSRAQAENDNPWACIDISKQREIAGKG